MSHIPRIAMIYDMDACLTPTGVTRHAMAQAQALSKRSDIEFRAVSGHIGQPDGLAFWESLDPVPRRQMPLNTRTMLRLWRLSNWPPIEWWTREVDWVYCPAEYFVPSKKARRAVTSHDVLQDLTIGGSKRRERLQRAFQSADVVLSVSDFNTRQLIEAFPDLKDRVKYVPNAADDLFFEPPSDRDRATIRDDLGLPPNIPYLLSVANFQARKNLVKCVEAVGHLPKVARGELAIVFIGTGNDSETVSMRNAIGKLPKSAVVKLPGYRQGRVLRAAYAEAVALVFPSTCESFGIPAVEAMSQGCPVALADNTALPEIGKDAGWYFDPENVEAISATVDDLIHNESERSRKRELGREIASGFRWSKSCDRLVQALRECPRSTPGRSALVTTPA